MFLTLLAFTNCLRIRCTYNGFIPGHNQYIMLTSYLVEKDQTLYIPISLSQIGIGNIIRAKHTRTTTHYLLLKQHEL
jgi:hypothetical protein